MTFLILLTQKQTFFSIADRLNVPIDLFDRAISDFLKVGLLKRK